MSLKILFLGTYGAVPSSFSGNTSIAVSVEGEYILIDTSGNPVQGVKAAGIDPGTLTTVVLTHAHVDHIYAFPSLVHTMFCMKRRTPLTVISDPVTTERAQELLGFFGLNRGKIGFDIVYGRKIADSGGSVKAGYTVDLFPGSHSVPSGMVRIKSKNSGLFYTADTGSIEAICGLAGGCSALVHETSGSHENIKKLSADGHSSGYQAGVNAACSGVRMLFLCHFGSCKDSNPESMEQEAKKEYNGRIIIPEPFRWYEL